MIIPIQYDDISNLSNDYYQVRMGEKYGVINLELKVAPELKYDYISSVHDEEGFFKVKASDKWGFINNSGKELTPLKYDFIRHFTEGYATVFREGRWYFLDNRGEELPIVCNGIVNFRNVSALMNGFCLVEYKSKKGFIDKNRKLVIPLIYDDTGLYQYGHVDVKLNDKWGVIDELGDIVVPIQYDTVDIDHSPNIITTKNGKEFYFDRTGNPIDKPQ